MYIVLTDTILKDLGLQKASEILVLGVVMGFSQDGQGEFYGSLSYLAEHLPISKRTAAECLKSLTDAGLLDKLDYYENGVKFCHYRVSQKLQGYCKNCNGGIANSATGGIAKIATHNKDIDRKDIKKNITPYNIPLPYSSEEFTEVWNTLCRQPKWKTKSADALKAQADFLADYPEAVAVKMMRNSIRNGWQGLFPLKESDQPRAERETAQSRAHEAFLRVAKETGVVSKFLNINVPPES